VNARREHERNHVPKMHRSRRRTPTSVEVERLAGFVSVEDLLKVSMGKEGASSKEEMGSLTSELLESFDELGRDLVCAELADELGVVAERDERMGRRQSESNRS
jgi:hypothetical protein